MTQIPGQEELPGMPPPIVPVAPEPMWVEARVEVSLTIKADIAGLAFQNRQDPTGYIASDTDQPLDYDGLTSDWLAKEGYQEWERGSVFLYNQISQVLEVDCWQPPWIQEQPFGDLTEIKYKWSPALQAALETSLKIKIKEPDGEEP